MNEGKQIRKVRRITAVSAFILMLLIISAWLKEGIFQDWRMYQSEYNHLIREVTDSQEFPGEEASEPREIYQIDLDHFARVDRCISCHLGLEDPQMSESKQPHKSHPGDHLINHPMQKYGCTICHGGQGRALDKKQAFGRDPDSYWPKPILSQPYIQSSCGKCHLTIFSGANRFEATDVFQEGQEIFSREGCLGCHKARRVGGILGPDLTEQGEKTKHEYNFQNIRGEQTISNWMKEHFRDPEMVSPGSQMLKIDLPEKDLESLVTFVMGLAKPDIPFEYFSGETLKEFKGERDGIHGNKITSFFCSACHGKRGEGKDYVTYSMGAPAILNRDFLRIASEEFIHFTIRMGRSDKQMASWAPVLSGWMDEEVDSVVNYMKNQLVMDSLVTRSLSGSGISGRGREIFAGNCEMCHGAEGMGDIALAINKKDLIGRVSDRFIYETISQGRNNSGMPAWADLGISGISDLVAYIRSWYPQSTSLLTDLPTGDEKRGSLKYHYLCSRCHGEFGEGDTGPAILNKDFLRAASDPYLYLTIAEGRSHTAMFGWSTHIYDEEHLGKEEISDIISYMRSASEQPVKYIYAGSNPGNSISGNALFGSRCARCHGLTGEGREAPALNNQEFLNAASNGFLMAAISLGRQGTQMPSWGKGGIDYQKLSGKERQDIVATIRNWQRIRIKY